MSTRGFRSYNVSHRAGRHRRGAGWRSVGSALQSMRMWLKGAGAHMLRGGAKRMIVWILALGAGFGILFFLYLWFTLPDIEDPRSFLASQSTVVLDRNGVELYRFFQEEDRTYVEGELLPEHLKNAIVAIEDARYYERGCLDVRALARVVFRFGQAGGASTLTRQLARNALDLKGENIISRKLKELILGCQMEHRFGKDELLSLYLNWIPFGQNAYGVAQASSRYFGVSVQDLTLAQSAVLAALPQAPTYYNPYGSHRHTVVTPEAEADILAGRITSVDQLDDEDIIVGLLGNVVGTGSTSFYVGGRTDRVLKNMEDQGLITEQERLSALEELEGLVFEPSREDIRAPHFVLWVRDQVQEMLGESVEDGLLERGGLQIETTLDWDMQEIAESVVAQHREDVLNRFGAHNIGLLALDAESREILAYVGNADFNDEDHGGKIDMVQVPRQPGSSFKPFVYAAAFEKGYSPATVIFDVKTEFGGDEPQNFDGQFWGPVTIRQALGASRNIPAAKAFFLGGGEDTILRLVASMGAPSPLERRRQLAEERGGFDYGWPLALGAAETPLAEMVNAYATFADAGVQKPVVAIRSIKDKNGNILYQADRDVSGTQVLDERIAYQITSVLSDESVRPDEFWRTRLTVPGYQTAAKTGTSNKCLEWTDSGQCRLRKPDNAWLLGYTPNIVAGVWAGNADSSAMFDKAGGLNTSSAIWNDFMSRAHRTLENPVASFALPEGIVQPQVSMLSGQLPTECTPVDLRRADVFLRENAPSLPDPACVTLMIDKVTGLLASDSCPEDAQEEQSFFAAHSLLPDRWPDWERGVQTWMDEQMVLWNASENHSGSLLKLPKAPTEECDPSLTPGRLEKPEITILTPSDGGLASHPAFTAEVEWSVGSAVREVRYELDGRRAAIEIEPPYSATIRVPRSADLSEMHTLTVTLEDEYFNKATDTVTFRFGEDRDAPSVRLTEPRKTSFAVGEDMTIRANADDDAGALKYVQFYLNDTLLSTKPQEPYELTYTLDVPAGTYRVRAVAEDMAGHTSDDVIVIGIGGAPAPQADIAPSVDTNAEDPAIMEPAGDVSLSVGETVQTSYRVPLVGGDDLYELRVVVKNNDSGTEELLLRLQDGEGMYRRTWASRKPGSFTLQLLTEARSGTVTEWGTRSILVQ